MRDIADIYARPFGWGVSDCCTAACDAFERWHGIDPMRSLRGACSDLPGALRLVRSGGGLLQVARDCAARAGLVEGAGDLGEFGVVTMPEGRHHRGFGAALGVRFSRGWWVKTEGGVLILPPASVVESWNA
ncbi:DUF6950 family protein [Mameliella sediminis]|uniref:DUF6950 family protein n=1 Tax=Mameliella sediminis TaxID=2836866 RepID=UPI001C454CC5|nr:hypothetical protein [Mameliella sediminis]MBV7394549.1 hypothetical protein [Mameliella sediminis]